VGRTHARTGWNQYTRLHYITGGIINVIVSDTGEGVEERQIQVLNAWLTDCVCVWVRAWSDKRTFYWHIMLVYILYNHRTDVIICPITSDAQSQWFPTMHLYLFDWKKSAVFLPNWEYIGLIQYWITFYVFLRRVFTATGRQRVEKYQWWTRDVS
jgi:hypothetical protein